jgi:hypothetical protein
VWASVRVLWSSSTMYSRSVQQFQVIFTIRNVINIEKNASRLGYYDTEVK